jgi:hypothetical protein
MRDIIKPAQEPDSRDMLFGDLPLDHWASVDSNESPWNLFKAVKENVDRGDIADAIEVLEIITALPGLESRQYLQAFHFINELRGSVEHDTKVFGVVLELSMPGGHDIVAIYADHSARYLNYSGKMIFWEQPDISIDKLIDDILEQAVNIVAKIGPWKDARPGPTGEQIARINFLTSHGLHFGEAPQRVLFHDPMAGRIMFAMLDLAKLLINKTEAV